MRVWNVNSGVCILILAGSNGHRNEVLSVVWIIQVILFPVKRVSLSFWNAAYHVSILQDFHPSNKDLIASCGMDNSVKIWSLKGGIFCQLIFSKTWSKQNLIHFLFYGQSFGYMLRNHLTGKIIHPNSSPNMFSFLWDILLPSVMLYLALYLNWLFHSIYGLESYMKRKGIYSTILGA